MHMRSIILVVCLSHVLCVKGSERVHFSKGPKGESIFTQGNLKAEEVFDDGGGITYLTTFVNPRTQVQGRHKTHRPTLLNLLKKEHSEQSEQPVQACNVQWLDTYNPRDVQYCFFLGLTVAMGLGFSCLSYLATHAR